MIDFYIWLNGHILPCKLNWQAIPTKKDLATTNVHVIWTRIPEFITLFMCIDVLP